MTAGSGIIHQEMPKGDKNGHMHGFQLWANLPSADKMTTPRYQDIKSKEIRILEEDDGSKIKVIAGNFKGVKGPVDNISADPHYLDIFVPAGMSKRFPFDTYRQGFAYIFEGSARFDGASNPVGVKVEKEYDGQEVEIRDLSGNRTLVLFDRGDEVVVHAGPKGVRFLLISGKPLKEPVAWHGPIVMNTQAELQRAIKELNNGTFIKTGSAEYGY
jgi:redox-sensitive bicupin YhaK (pirin superfamily)